MKRLITILCLLSAIAATAQAQIVERKTLSLEGAHKVIAAAVAYAKKVNAPGGVIAVVDDGGNLMALERLDGTFAAGANISIGKARTAVLFKRPTKAFEDIIKNGRTAMVALPDAYFTPLQGGVPIAIDGQIVGGVGVSGASSAQQDEELAMAGANQGPDGIVTARELAGFDWWGTQLVVLSACESGVGAVPSGDGVYGMRRALVLAGVASQVVSLWSVDDASTRELMRAYYAELARGTGRAAALRAAKLHMMREPHHAHPQHWAAFIPAGDWRPLDKSTMPRPP